MKIRELTVENYNAATDYTYTVECMNYLGFYREDQDTPERMRDITMQTPDAIRVSRFTGERTVEACIHIPDSLIPAVFRQGVHPNSPYKDELLNVMINDASRILRKRGARRMEDLIDMNVALPPSNEVPGLKAAVERGFRPTYPLIGVVRELWTPDNQPVADLPVGEAFTVRYTDSPQVGR